MQNQYPYPVMPPNNKKTEMILFSICGLVFLSIVVGLIYYVSNVSSNNQNNLVTNAPNTNQTTQNPVNNVNNVTTLSPVNNVNNPVNNVNNPVNNVNNVTTTPAPNQTTVKQKLLDTCPQFPDGKISPGNVATYDQYMFSGCKQANTCDLQLNQADPISKALINKTEPCGSWQLNSQGYSFNLSNGWQPIAPVTTLAPVNTLPPLDQIIVYTDSNFQGQQKSLGIGSYKADQLGVPNDSISSITIPDGLRVKVYTDNDFKGDVKILTQSTWYVGDDFNDKISSIIVEKNIGDSNSSFQEAVPFNIKWNFSNKCLAVDSGKSNNGTQIVIFDCKNEPNQLFVQDGDLIKWNNNRNKCISVQDGTNNWQNHPDIILWDCDKNDKNQLFKQNSNTIQWNNSSVNSAQCISVMDGTNKNYNQNKTILWPCNAQDQNQQLEFKKI